MAVDVRRRRRDGWRIGDAGAGVYALRQHQLHTSNEILSVSEIDFEGNCSNCRVIYATPCMLTRFGHAVTMTTRVEKYQ